MTNSFVSIIIPCKNEESYISACLESVLAFDLVKDSMEILIIDGMSTDATLKIIKTYCDRYPFIKFFQNPKEIVPTAMNIGIKNAKGNIIVRLDAHSEYPQNYVKDCVSLLEKTGAANAGGRFVNIPNGNGAWAVPIAEVTAHRFGVGAGAFRVSTKPGFTDTVPFGTFRKDIFDKIGLFDERLTRSQDYELNARIRKAGYKIAFDPDIEIFYKNQATLKGLLHQAFYTGMWNVYNFCLNSYVFKWRGFIPMAFATYLLFIPFVFVSDWRWLYLLPAILYVCINTAVSLMMKHSFRMRGKIGITFAAYHLTYGIGSLFGIVNIMTGHWKKHLGQPLVK